MVKLKRKEVHPHACGEYQATFETNYAYIGSPPRLWGIRVLDGHRKALGRFTPTPVGNTVDGLN